MNKFKALGLFLFCCLNIQGQILDKTWGKIAASNDSNWLSSPESLNLAKTILLLQKEIGGWEKNLQPQKLTRSEIKAFASRKADNLGATIDNGATITEMKFLAKMYSHHGDERLRIGFLKGLDYLLKAQYESGGWPQFYPLKKGYYTHITFNDDAMVNVMRLLKDIVEKDIYDFLNIPKQKLIAAQIAFDKGVECIVNTQYKQNGTLTSWCAQHNENTLLPAKARSYELPSLSGKESAQIVLLLMTIKNPSIKVKNTIESAVSWFETSKLTGFRINRVYNKMGRVIKKTKVLDSAAAPLWARFMELENNSPFFCDRDGIKKKNLSEIGDERRNGYRWYTEEPREVLEKYPIWKKRIANQTENGRKTDIYNITVSKDGIADFTNIQEAINAAKGFPDKCVQIHLKNGIYREKIEVYEWNTNMKIIGEDRALTVITYDDYFDKLNLGRNSTFHTPTFLIQGNDFLLKNVTIKNTAGDVGQAIALAINANRVKIENCSIKGNQDTLYVTGEGFKQYFKNCYIEGTTDFIFGQATALFENCEIYSKSNSYITAASTPKGENFGFVFQNCKLTAKKGLDKVYLGRPWRTYAKTVFIECTMEEHIEPKGWDNWGNHEAEILSFYAEYKNLGPGFKPNKRVLWSNQLTKKQVKKYTKERILGNSLWFNK